jgi:putative NADH-flavin reductase
MIPSATAALITAVPAAGVPRLAVVGGGGGSLSDTLDWTYLCPPHKNLVPGDERCGYAVRGDDRPR